MAATEAPPRPVGPGGMAEPPPASPRLTHRLRLAAVCAILAAVAFVQDPGRIAADTKLDLYVDPAGFLGKALHLWEPLGFFGQLQNQGYGYLFPVGPFFVLGDLAGLPAWVVQRLWWTVLLCTAFLGVVRLARLLGMKGAAGPILAGLAYALAPRMVTELGVLSVEILPFAVAPWVVIPLASTAQGRHSLRRGAALSGAAVLCAGGVNAVATAVLLPLGAWWILTRFRGRARVVLAAWWILAVALATLWWAIPLLVLGRYSPPFLDWIESSSVTTLITSPDTVVRGTSQWVAYVVDAGGAVWPGGWQLVTMPVLVAVTGLVAAAGLAGLALRGTPYRPFLVGTLLLGVVLVSLGHVGDVQGLLAEQWRTALDGVLAPLRNTHKFDLLLRLPIALGVGFLAQACLQRVRGRWQGIVVAVLAIVIVVGAWPAVTGSLVRDRSFTDVPGYWSDVADYLAEQQPAGRALLVPGASFGVYSWGRSQDEPLQPLATTPWAVRDAVPLSSAGNVRWLDAIQERLDSGRGTPGLADALARAGVTYVVLRNDIDQRRSETPRTVLIRQALVRSGGFTPAAGFGPALPPYRTPTTVVDFGLQDTTAAVEVWRVESPYAPQDPRAWLRDASDVLVTSGSAESVVDLADAGVLVESAVVTAGDEGSLARADGVVTRAGVTDGYLRTEVNVGRARDNRSAAMTADQPFAQDRKVHDYYPVDPTGRQAVAEFAGGTVTASSSGSDPTALRARSSAAQPWAALDGDGATAWMSGDLDPGVGQWWQVTTDRAFSAGSIPVRLVVGDAAGTPPTEVTVTTDAGEITVPVAPTDLVQRLPLPPGPTSTLRLTLAAVADGSSGEGFGLREVGLPVPVTRTVRTAGAASGGPIVLTARRGEQSGCAAVAGQLVCSSVLGEPGEERAGIRRIVSVTEPGDYRVRVMVRPRPGTGLDRLLRPIVANAPRATATSVATSDPASRPQAAIDGVMSTSWIASPLDSKPELTLRWGEPREISGVRLAVNPDLAASTPLSVTVTVNGIETPGIVSGRGVVRFPPQSATSLSIRFENSVSLRTLDPATGQYTALPLGVTEVSLLGASDLLRGPRLFDQASVSCGFGPEVVIDGSPAVKTEVSATVSEALSDTLLPAPACQGRLVSLGAGDHEIDVASTEEFAVESVTLEPLSAAPALSAIDPAAVRDWGATQRSVAIDASDHPRLLETGENANAGWVATLDGAGLQPVRVDGWRQAWLVPAGAAGVVSMDFAPDAPYRAGLLLGLLAALVLLALALVRGRAGEAAPVPRATRAGALALLAGGLVAAVLVGGVAGLLAGAACAALAYGTRRPVVVFVLASVAALAAAAIPWPQSLSAPWWLAGLAGLAAIGAVAAATSPTRQTRAAVGGTTPGADAPG
ncbi:MAG: alpha-(1-_3)-arabinofuranosyltransferase domain-containing protein [Candidatus Nanopelagicales bacterium]